MITWNDLTTIFGDLIPGATIYLTTTFRVEDTLTDSTTINNEARGVAPQRSDGSQLPSCRNRATLRYSPPSAPSLLTMEKSFALRSNSRCTRTLTPNDILQFSINYENDSVNPITNVIIEDNLPASITYIPDSMLLNGVPLPDGGGITRFPLDEGGYNVGNISPQQSGLLTFDVRVSDVATEIRNQAEARSSDLPLGSNPIGLDEIVVYTPTTTLPEPVVAVDLRLIEPSDGLALSGDVASFDLKIMNTSAVTITTLHLTDIFQETHLTFYEASPSPNTIEPGVITWNDLTQTFGDIAPDQSFSFIISFIVDPLPANITTTANRVTVKEAILSDGTNVQACGAVANLNLLFPTPTPDDNGGGSGSTPTPVTPTPNIVPPTTLIPPLTTSPIIPVTLLPETGQPPPILSPLRLSIILFVVFLWLAWSLGRRKH